VTRARLDAASFSVGGALPRVTAGIRERRSLWLRLTDSNGVAGWGEAAPLPGYSPDTLDECRRALDGLAWEDFADTRATSPHVAATLGALEGALDARLPAARCAAETALLDLWSRRLGVPARRLLGASGAVRSLSLCPVLAAEGALGARARELVNGGASCLKIKLGRGDFDRELELLEELPRVSLRFDFNRACPRETARDMLDRLARYEPEFVEEPVAPKDWEALAGSRVPLALDETLQELELEEALSRAPRLPWRAAILKPMTLGGLTRCRALSERARAAGLAVVVSHLFEGPVALNAYAELALSLEESPFSAGLMPHAALAAFPPAPLPGFERASLVEAARSRPGLQLPEAFGP
jgi:o-succinylbenzoate synthase